MADGPPEGPEVIQAASEACLRLLAVRARSRHELAQALGRKGFSPAVQAQVLERLAGYGLLDDAAFARERAAALLGRGRLGPAAVLARLEAHGLSGEAARAALAAASEAAGFEPLAAARRVLERRGLGGGRALGPRERARAARLLLGRGFCEDVVEQALGGAVLETPGADE